VNNQNENGAKIDDKKDKKTLSINKSEKRPDKRRSMSLASLKPTYEKIIVSNEALK
jgi:hypothetical protein